MRLSYMEKRRGERHNLTTRCASCMSRAKSSGEAEKVGHGIRLIESVDMTAVQAHQALTKSSRLTTPGSSYQHTCSIHNEPTCSEQHCLVRGDIAIDKPILSNHGHINLPIRCPSRSVPSLLS